MRTHRLMKDEITAAIRDGIGHDQIDHVVKTNTANFIHVKEHDEAIKVMKDDVILPDSLKGMASGIMLDVGAILASR